MKYQWLHDPIIEYITNNPGVEKIEIVHHFKIVEAAMGALAELIKIKKIYTKWTPLQLPQGTTKCYIK